jgi:predicted permease
MDSLIFAFNSVAPIIFTVAVGYILKRLGLMTPDFSKKANKLVFRVFLPVMLFINIYGIESSDNIDLGYVFYAIAILLIIFGLALPTVILLTKKKTCRGALMQGIFRSNYALIGIPLASSLFPENGAAVATLLSAFLVPCFNILAVIALSIFNNNGEKPNFKKVLLGIIKNPLILSIAAGGVALLIRYILVSAGISFRISEIPAIWNTMKNLSSIATPIALLVLGAQFEFSAIKSLRREIISGVVLRSVIVPIIGIGAAYLLFGKSFGGAQYAALVAAFCTPIAVSSVPMAQEMGADTELAGQLVVFTTISSAVTVFVASAILRAVGIF